MKNKKIDLKEVTNSPYFVAVIMFLVIALIIAGISFLVVDINNTKKSIVEARQLYATNVKEMAMLEELKAKSEVAEKQLEVCKGILPDTLGDVYVLQENVISKCEAFGLTVTAIENTVAKNETYEAVFNISVTGTFANIYNLMNYYSNLEQIHRFDSISLTRESANSYSAVISLAILSDGPAEGAVATEETTAAQ